MVTSITPILEQHMPRAQARAGGRIAYSGFDFCAYVDSMTSTAPLTKQTPAQSEYTLTNCAGTNLSNQQFSITSITNSTGAISERYAYTAYGQPTILDASGSPLSPQVSSLNNRYTYTGREWDATLGLHHFRARWMSPSTGRFLTRDPIATVKNLARAGDLGYLRNPPAIDFDILMQALNLFQYVGSSPISRVDPSGLLFGFSYGNFCGWDERGQGGPPIDFLDRACKRHDQCQATWRSCNPYHIHKCSVYICLDADDAVNGGCASDSPDPAKCIDAAKQIKRLFCAIAGLPWQDPHNPPVIGGPKI